MKARRVLASVALLGALAGTVGCELPSGRVAQGQLYLSGEARFDAYFRDVHQLQIFVAGWGDERKHSRHPLIGALSLTPDAGDVTILQTMHDRLASFSREGGGTKLEVTADDARMMVLPGTKGDPSFYRAVEETVRLEIERDRRFQQLVPRVEELAKTGRALEPHVQPTFEHKAPGKVSEVKAELSASLEALQDVTLKARHASRASEDFIAEIQRSAAVAVDPPRQLPLRHLHS